MRRPGWLQARLFLHYVAEDVSRGTWSLLGEDAGRLGTGLASMCIAGLNSPLVSRLVEPTSQPQLPLEA